MNMYTDYAALLCFLFFCFNACNSATILPAALQTQESLEKSILQSDDYRGNPVAAVAGISNEFHSRKRRELSDWLIAPNTRWCGRGNTAGHYNHLGGATSADKCCRRHDHCQIHIPGMSKKYDLFNYRPFTLSHCSCDRRFRTCLKMAENSDANMVGKLFFNVVQTECFVLRSEKVCIRRSTEGSCEKEEVKQKAYLRDNLKF